MILVVSYADEDHTVGVIDRLTRAGHEVALVDLAEFPSSAGVLLAHAPGEPAAYRFETPRGTLDLTRVGAVWWRRIRPFGVDHSITGSRERSFALSETEEAVLGMLESLPATWVNPQRNDQAAHHKPYQWAIAREVGLTVPRTLVTNQPGPARDFIRHVGVGKVVYKAFLAIAEAWRETRIVREEDLARLDDVRYAPVIFQEYIHGVDVRVTVVGEHVLAAEIDATSTSYPADMRMVVGDAPVRPVDLPVGLADALRALVGRLGLVYGAIDLRRTPEGDHYFFEINPAGLWRFIEDRIDLPISDAVASTLVRLDDEAQAGDRSVVGAGLQALSR
jgi:glutathione synthase/RimK-type ligase-like ATP-grasp enzyme